VTFDYFPPPRREADWVRVPQPAASGYQPTQVLTPQAAAPPRAEGTPIYDALYEEFRRLFRTLPGDRAGEENLQFRGFSAPSGGRHRVVSSYLSLTAGAP
jgi:hypothetical protein